MRILVVEDERQLAGHIVRALERHGHSAVARHDGLDGLQAALAARGPDFFRVERFLPPAQPPDAAPYYDHNARQLLARGRIGQAINHRDHVAPVLDAIARHAAAAPLRAQAG